MGKVLLSLATGAVLAAPAAGQEYPGGGYRIGPRDVVDVKVFEDSQLNAQYQVTEDGTIRLPLVGTVVAEGLTQDGLAARLKEVLEEGFLQRASVSVEVLQFRSRPISVLGAVRQPGSLNYSGRLSLIEALTAAGGLSGSQGRSVTVLRRASNGLVDQVTISLDDLLVKVDASVNIPIFANDLISVPPAVDVTIYLLGEIAGAGAITFKSTERVTLLAVIARAGGLTARASNKIRLQRRTPDGKVQETVVRYKRLLAGAEPDPELRHGDLILVKESFF